MVRHRKTNIKKLHERNTRKIQRQMKMKGGKIKIRNPFSRLIRWIRRRKAVPFHSLRKYFIKLYDYVF